MARCCGGKNAGKPIGPGRYVAGLGVFLGYHGVVAVGLSVAARAFPDLDRVKRFHRQVVKDELREIARRDEINLVLPFAAEEACDVPVADFELEEMAAAT